ncbi:MAG: hypothetical protein M0R05_01115 [Bacilli bacterium]|nr:hypothetical protein [Bacilli bacterium]MDD4076380.1 hypothetical protein [Bacilli bacterium]MDD4389072.1 hypothetical protein [Bacilli bacterium]
MINYNDYKAYLLQNHDFIMMMKEKQIQLYDRIFDIMLVLDYISDLAAKGNKIDEEMHVIFEVGFSYMHEQLEEMKLYYEIYFQKDVISFKEYDMLINYSLYLGDLEDSLKDKNLYCEETKTAIKKIADKIDEIIRERKPINTEIFDDFNVLLEGYIPVGTLTTLEIFALISEELNI